MSEPEQLPLEWNVLTEPPRARRSDPISSHRAADRAERFLRGHAAIIVRQLLACPGLTATQMAGRASCPLSVVQIDRRTKELENAKWIVRDPTPEGLVMFPTAKARLWQTGERAASEILKPPCLN